MINHILLAKISKTLLSVLFIILLMACANIKIGNVPASSIASTQLKMEVARMMEVMDSYCQSSALIGVTSGRIVRAEFVSKVSNVFLITGYL